MRSRCRRVCNWHGSPHDPRHRSTLQNVRHLPGFLAIGSIRALFGRNVPSRLRNRLNCELAAMSRFSMPRLQLPKKSQFPISRYRFGVCFPPHDLSCLSRESRDGGYQNKCQRPRDRLRAVLRCITSLRETTEAIHTWPWTITRRNWGNEKIAGDCSR